MRKRSVSSSPYLKEARKKKRRTVVKKILFYALALAVFFVGLSFLAKWEKLNIKSVQIVGNKVVDSAILEEIAKKEIDGYYLWFFPKANFLLYPKAEIKQELENKFKIFKNISVELKGVKTLSIEVSEREGSYTWCGNNFSIESKDSKCYFMDEDGYIFDEAPYFSSDVYLKFFGKVLETAEVPLGHYFFPDVFPKLVSFRESVEKMGVKTSSFLVKDDGEIELYLPPGKSSSNLPKIILQTDSDFGKIVENLEAALTTEPLQSSFKKEYSLLKYIDLRFGNKIFYKF